MRCENEKDNSIDSGTYAESGNKRDGRYLFGYYSPYEDNKNIIDMLKDFVSREGTTEIDILGQP